MLAKISAWAALGACLLTLVPRALAAEGATLGRQSVRRRAATLRPGHPAGDQRRRYARARKRSERALLAAVSGGMDAQARAALRRVAAAGGGGKATFDGDGTLWAGDTGLGFFNWMLRNKHYPKPARGRLNKAWKDYRVGKLDSERLYEMMVTGMAGMKEGEVVGLSQQYFDANQKRRIFRPMLNVVRAVGGSGIEPWVVSGAPYWVVAAGARHFGIPAKNVIGLRVEVDGDGRLTDQIIRPVPWMAGKRERIKRDIGERARLAWGNGRGDLEMLRDAVDAAFVVNPSPKVTAQALKHGWKIHMLGYEQESHSKRRHDGFFGPAEAEAALPR